MVLTLITQEAIERVPVGKKYNDKSLLLRYLISASVTSTQYSAW